MSNPKMLQEKKGADLNTVTFGICAAGDPRIDSESRERTVNIVKRIAGIIADRVKMPDGKAVNVVWSPLLIDGEKQAGRRDNTPAIIALIKKILKPINLLTGSVRLFLMAILQSPRVPRIKVG